MNDSVILIIMALVAVAIVKPDVYDKAARAWLSKREDKS